MRIDRDTNGNKVLKLSSSDLGGHRGFSIQTLGNLPKTHRLLNSELQGSKEHRKAAAKEVEVFVKRHGTPKQKLGMFSLLARY